MAGCIAELQIEPNQKQFIEKLCVVAWDLVGCHVGNSSDVTLAFEDAQIIHKAKEASLWLNMKEKR